MRAVFLFGGFVGFAVVATTGWLSGRAGDSVLRDAAIGCLVGAFIFKWFWSRVVFALAETVRAKRAAQRALEEAAAAAKAAPVGASKAR